MTELALFLVVLVVLFFALDRLQARFIKSLKRFPYCRRCGSNMHKFPLQEPLPGAILGYLAEHKLPDTVVTTYICPKGCRRAWFAPRVGNAERGVFITA